MGFMDRFKAKPKTFTATATMLFDEELVAAIDAHHRALDGPRLNDGNEPNECKSCLSWLDPGFRRCPNCGTVVKRSSKGTQYWYQEVVGEAHYQPQLEHLIAGLPRRDDGGVRAWVAVALCPEPGNQYDKNAVQIQASDAEGHPHIVGYIPRKEAAAYQKILLEIGRQDKKSFVGCRGLIEGGFQTRDNKPALWGIKLLLPLPAKLRDEFTVACSVPDDDTAPLSAAGYCGQCGRELAQGVRYCSSCGAQRSG